MNPYNMRITGLLFLFLFLCGSCAEKHDHKGLTPLVELSGSFLYKEDLQAVLPVDLSEDDSILFVEHYIRSWAEDVLLYKKAESNVPNNEEIERLVENYRKALIMHAYQQELVTQQLSKEITEPEMAAYFETNKELFRLEHPLMKGLFIKVPLTAPQLANVRKWYKSESQDAIEHLEKYSLQNAVKYEYFHNKWVPVTEILDLMPVSSTDPESSLRKERTLELKDSAFYYFLYVSDYRGVGEQEPFEAALPKLKDMMMNMKQVSFMKQVKNDLYQRAVDKKRIKYYY